MFVRMEIIRILVLQVLNKELSPLLLLLLLLLILPDDHHNMWKEWQQDNNNEDNNGNDSIACPFSRAFL